MDNKEQRVDEIVGLVYEDVHDASLLIPAMQGICREVGAIAGHYVCMNVSSGEISASYISSDPAYMQGDAEYGAACLPRPEHGARPN